MKKFILLFSMYLSLVAIAPCMDILQPEEIHNDFQTHQTSNTSDACSQFCICTCCGMTITIAVQSICLEIPCIHTSRSTEYACNLSADFSLSIWQPPKHA